MKLRTTLARRLRALMDSRLDLNTQTKVASRAGLGQATVQRILTQQAAATIDSIDDLAGAFRVSPADLLLEHGDAALLRAFAQLNLEDKARVMHYIELSAAAQTGHAAGRARLDFQETRPAPTSMAAATSRASARKPSADSMTNNAAAHDNKTNALPKARKRPRA